MTLDSLLAFLAGVQLAATPVRISFEDAPGAESPDYDDSKWPEARPDTYRLFRQLTRRGIWLRCAATAPEALDGEPLRLSITGEGLVAVYVNGRKTAERSGRLEEAFVIWPKIESGKRYVVALHTEELALTPPQSRGYQFFRLDTPALERIRNLERSLSCAAWLLPSSLGARASSLASSGKSAESVGQEASEDARDPSKRYAAAVERFLAAAPKEPGKLGAAQLAAACEKALPALAPLDEALKRHTIHVAPHAHIDLGWVWPREETPRRLRRLIPAACDFLDANPEALFIQDQAEVYRSFEDGAVMEDIRRHVRRGAWAPVGGEMSMPCAITPGGEAFVRQFLYGKRYFREHFGVDVRVAWRLDCFGGHAGTLPQILQHCGMDAYVFRRGISQDIVEFWWESPGGARVLGYNLPGGYDNGYRAIDEIITPRAGRYFRHSRRKDWLLLSGMDFSAPHSSVVENLASYGKAFLRPSIRFSTPQQVLARLRPGPDLPVLQYDLDPEVFGPAWATGCLLTYGRIKQRNRELEGKLMAAEKIAFFGGGEYPAEVLREGWRLVLFNEMHDILCGTSSPEVYAWTMSEYDQVERTAEEIIERSARRLAAQVDTRGPGVPLLIFNPLSWARGDIVERELYAPWDFKGDPILVGPDGRRAPVQWRELPAPPHMDSRRLLATFRADDLPPLGYGVYHLAFQVAPAKGALLKARSDLLENEFLRVCINPKTGNVASIYDKASKRHVLKPGCEGNVILALEEQARASLAYVTRVDGKAWDIGRPEAIEVAECGPVRARIRVRKKFRNTAIVQEITLGAGARHVDFAVEIDCRDTMFTFKAAFPANVPGGVAVCEKSYGALPHLGPSPTPAQRKLVERDWPGLLEKQTGVVGTARGGEWAAQNWMDVSNGKHGVALLNRGRYTYDLGPQGEMRLSLLRNVTGLDETPGSDCGRHRIEYRLLPHRGSWRDSAPRAGAEFNSPVLVWQDAVHGGGRKKMGSFLTLDRDNVSATVVKAAEDDPREAIVRLVETAGEDGTYVTLRFDRALASADRTDAIEWRTIERLNTRKNKVGLSIGPFEIATVRVRFGR